ncbi:hypothetical protein HHX47_DHR8000145 [Lentinula edodes]|nr:hypothetical protein HHX47_DHR8000145 [Lentinula edodes]
MAIFAVLLRAADISFTDKYETAINAIGPRSRGVCVPVLETVLMNLENLKQTIAAGPKVDGVIMTSARSCEAWKAVVAQSADEQTQLWSNVPFYVVGAATAASLREIYPKPDQIRGEDSGTAELLARFILEQTPGNRPKYLLYLTGDKNRETLPKVMDEGHVDLVSLQVYETCGSSRFPDDLREALQGCQRDTRPSNDDKPLVRIAAIGPTTASFLRDKLRLHVDAISAKPKPALLVEAIRECLYT